MTQSKWEFLPKMDRDFVASVRQETDWNEGLELWVRARFRCEYCGCSLLENTLTYRLSQGDHILPYSKYKSLGQDPNNLAQVCGVCNQIKRNWDPAEAHSDPAAIRAAVDQGSVSTQLRSTLLELCRSHVRWKLLMLERELAAVRRAVFDSLAK